MKRSKFCVMLLLAVAAVTTGSCNKEHIEYVEYTPGEEVIVLTVDYTTNRFLGGYTLPVDFAGDDFSLEADYNSPLDLGNVTIYEKGSGVKLFAGYIGWMGKGERTYPAEILPAKDFARTSERSLPELIRFYYAGGEPTTDPDGEISKAWTAVRNLDIVRKATKNAPDAKVYLSLYRCSVGVGDPADWYWLIFIRG